MKINIKNFDQFFEELKPSTYMDAASKLKKMSGKHLQRATELEKWAKIIRYKNLETFQLNGKIFKFQYQSDYSYVTSLDADVSITVKQGPIDCYLRHIDFESDSDLNHKPDCIWFQFFFIEKESSIIFHAFSFEIDLKWGKDEEGDIFTVDNIKVIFGLNENDDKILFSNRKDAYRFRKDVLNKKAIKDNLKGEFYDHYNKLVEFFQSYSTAKEFDSLLDKISNININQLWD